MRQLLPRIARAASSSGWSALALGGLLLSALAVSSARGGAEGAPARRVVLALPADVTMLASLAACLAMLLWFAFLMALARRGGKEWDGGRAMWGMLLFAAMVAAVAVWQRSSPDGVFLRPPGPPATPVADAQAPVEGLPTVVSTLFSAALGTLLLAGAFASLALILFALFGDRLTEWWARRNADPPHPLAAAVDESLDDLHDDADPRPAIIRCYRRFEQVLARSRVPRAPWQTPLEFMRDALGRLPLPREATERLTRLFEMARFSVEPLAPADRDAARGALVEIRKRLDAGPGDGRAG